MKVTLGAFCEAGQRNCAASRTSGPESELELREFGHKAAVAAFDNFEATADGVRCDGVPLPPLKPRP